MKSQKLHKLHKFRKLKRRQSSHDASHPTRRLRRRMRTAVAVFGLAVGAVSGAHAQSATRVSLLARESATALDARWQDSLDAFAAIDKEKAPEPGGVVFVGSSSIRLWNDLEREFGTRGITKRGFGGSRLADCARYAARLVLPYKPRQVIVYAGDNDLADGDTPEGVLESYRDLVAQIHAALPETRIAYVSIKPSPSRAALMPSAIRANELIRDWSKSDARLDYIDIYSKMLDAEGQPRKDLFLADSLHLNGAGYAIWKDAIAARIR